jgi:hypothetical protein
MTLRQRPPTIEDVVHRAAEEVYSDIRAYRMYAPRAITAVLDAIPRTSKRSPRVDAVAIDIALGSPYVNQNLQTMRPGRKTKQRRKSCRPLTQTGDSWKHAPHPAEGLHRSVPK